MAVGSLTQIVFQGTRRSARIAVPTTAKKATLTLSLSAADAANTANTLQADLELLATTGNWKLTRPTQTWKGGQALALTWALPKIAAGTLARFVLDAPSILSVGGQLTFS